VEKEMEDLDMHALYPCKSQVKMVVDANMALYSPSLINIMISYQLIYFYMFLISLLKGFQMKMIFIKLTRNVDY
jgi:hypothetical protein